MASFFSGLKDQVMKMLPALIEQNEPMVEQKLRETLRTIKASNPSESQLFLTNWRKLNTAIESELSAAPVAPTAGKRKRTRKLKHRKH
jgi:cell division septal protein FtsQ